MTFTLPANQTLVLNLSMRSATLLSASPDGEAQVLSQQRFTPNGMRVLLPLLEAYPRYCPYDVLVASLLSSHLRKPGGSCAIGLVSAPAAGIWTGVSLLTSQLDELYQRWRHRGVAFDGPPTMQAWHARTAIFSDIERNRYQLVEVPSSL